MSSASSGRYQSRLFNFFHRQSRQLKQQSDRALGNLRVAATWVATVGLYPVYALFQSTNSVAKQMNQAVQQSLPQLPANNLDYLDPPSTDTPIQRVLLAVDNLPSEYAIVTTLQDKKPANLLTFLASWRFKSFSNSPRSTSSLTQPKPSPSLTYTHLNIQGIATQLSSRTLVLTTAQNQILDIFTSQQQKRLQERIIDEVASYWRSMQRREARNERLEGEERIYPSMQRREARGERLEGEERIYPFRLLAIVDRTVARLESKHLVPVARHEVSTLSANLSKRGWNLVQQMHKLTVSLSGTQPVNSKLPAIATLNDGIRLNNFESYTFRLQTLIFAAINHFFGSHKGIAIASPKTNSTQPKLQRQRTFKLPTAAITDQDPWLTLDDLFGEPELPGGSTFDQQNTPTLKQLAGNTNVIPSNSTRHSLGKLRRILQLPPSKQVSGRVLGQKPTKGRRREVDKQLSLPKSAGYSSANQISRQSSTQNTQVEAKPDWIETNATAIGYVKHPLEKILEWLDRLILWIEEMLVTVLGQLQRLWQGK